VSAEITPPPQQPLHLVLWHGLELGYYLLLGAAFLVGLVFVLFDISVFRLVVALFGWLLLVLAVLPYRGMRVWRWWWLRLEHGVAVLLTYVYPARRRQLAALAARLREVVPSSETEPADLAPEEVSQPAPFVRSLGTDTRDWNPAWTAAWRAAAAVPESLTPPAPSGKPTVPLAQLAGDEGDGLLPPVRRPASVSGPLAAPAPATRQVDWSTLTLGQIRAWGYEADLAARRAE
jgi:hypothetical protein